MLRPAKKRNSTTVAQGAGGDLDTIVLKTLRKEPERRYLSAQELSDDIGRYLDGKPVAARGDALAYRVAKFTARHRAAVLVAGGVLASLLGSLVLIVRQSQVAEEQRRRCRTPLRRGPEARRVVLVRVPRLDPVPARGDPGA